MPPREPIPGIRFRSAPWSSRFLAAMVFSLAPGLIPGTWLTYGSLSSAPLVLGSLGVPRRIAFDLPGWYCGILALISIHLGNYAAHCLLHRYDVLWEIHKIHHSSRLLDWLATFRSHILEQALRRLLAPLMLILVGI